MRGGLRAFPFRPDDRGGGDGRGWFRSGASGGGRCGGTDPRLPAQDRGGRTLHRVGRRGIPLLPDPYALFPERRSFRICRGRGDLCLAGEALPSPGEGDPQVQRCRQGSGDPCRRHRLYRTQEDEGGSRTGEIHRRGGDGILPYDLPAVRREGEIHPQTERPRGRLPAPRRG